MSLRPLVLLTVVSSVLGSCRPTSSQQASASDAARAADSGAQSIEVRIGTAGDGHLINPSAHPWQSASARLTLNAPYQSWGDEGTFVHLVAHTPTLQPCVESDFFLENKHIGRGDRHGAFGFRRRAGNGSNVLLAMCKGPDDKWYRGYMTYGAHSRSQEFERPIIYVHADRGVYKPGQKIRVRALAWRLRGEYVALADQRVAISLEDRSGNPVGGAVIETDEDGVAAVDLPLPRNMSEGQYKLVATHVQPEQQQRRGYYGYGRRQAEPNRAEAPIQVRRFETPVIEVRHTIGEFLTPAMSMVAFNVSLSYLDGAPFRTARVEVALGAGADRVALPPRNVSGAGPHSFELTSEQLQRFRSQSELRVELSATDDTGRKDTVVRAMRVVDNPYRASLELDRNGYATGERVDAALRVTDLNSVVQRGKSVRIEGCGQNITATTDDTGVAHARFAMPSESCSLQAFAADARGAIASASVTHTVVRPMQSRVLEQRVREREPVTITVNFPAEVIPVERVVHGDLTDSSGAIVDVLSIPIEGDAQHPTARATIRPPSWGSMLVTLYTLGVPRDQRNSSERIGLLTDGQSLAVGATPHLEVTLHGTEGDLRPGDSIPVQIDVKRDGRPASAALGVSLVDRGVINMLDPYEHPPFDRFYDPQQKVLVSTGAQTLTWPVVQRTWGQDRYDIGWLPSFGMHHGGRTDDDANILWPSQETVNALAREAQASAPSPQQIPAPTTIAAADQGGGPGEGTFGFGNIGTIGHGSGSGSGQGYGSGGGARRARAASARFGGLAGGGGIAQNAALAESDGVGEAGGEVQNTRGRQLVDSDEAQEPMVVVRTGDDDTSLWLPRAHAEGAQSMQVRVPDMIGEHQFNVLASDRQGGIALARATLTVRQAMYVRADVPESLAVGDEAIVTLVARNNGDSPVELDLVLRAPQWTIAAIDPTHASAPAHGQATARFRVTATQAGRVRYEAEARGGALTDVLRANTWVRPAGSPTHERVSERVRAGQPFRATASRAIPGCAGADCEASYRVARLSIAMPESTSWEPALEYAQRVWADGIHTLCARVDAASIFAANPTHPMAKSEAQTLAAQSYFELLGRLRAGSAAEGAAARRGPPLRELARALETLATARRAGYPMPATLVDETYARMIAALRGPISEDDRWLALRAAIELRAPELRANSWGRHRDGSLLEAPLQGAQALQSARARVERGVGTEPRSFVEALLLLRSFAKNATVLDGLRDSASSWFAASDAGTEGDRSAELSAYVLRAARALLAWRRAQTIEPGSWDRAHTVYASAAALMVMHSIDPEAARGELREVSQFLRSNRARWESWWDAESSSYALQALSLAGTQPERAGAEVIIKVDGREVKRVRIDPRDPWQSSLELRQIELDEAIGVGPGAIEVEYTGALTADVTLDIERWSSRARSEQSVSASAPERARRGAVVPVRVRATRPSDSRLTEVWMSLPPFARLDEAALDAMVARRAIGSWTQRDGLLVLSFAQDSATLDASVEVRASRAGRFSIAAVELRDATGRRAGSSGPTVLVE